MRLLTAEAFERHGLRIGSMRMRVVEQNVETLRKRLDAPLLGIVPFAFGTSEVRACLDMQALEDSLRREPLAPEVLPPE